MTKRPEFDQINGIQIGTPNIFCVAYDHTPSRTDKISMTMPKKNNVMYTTKCSQLQLATNMMTPKSATAANVRTASRMSMRHAKLNTVHSETIGHLNIG